LLKKSRRHATQKQEVAMRSFVEKVAAAIHRDQRRRAIRIPRRELPRRSRKTFVPAGRSAAIAY
jgi:hypothetical protein